MTRQKVRVACGCEFLPRLGVRVSAKWETPVVAGDQANCGSMMAMPMARILSMTMCLAWEVFMLARLRFAVLTSFIVLLGTLFAVAVNASPSALPQWSVVTIPGLPSGASLSAGARGLWTGSRGEVYVWATRPKPTTDIPESWLYKTSDGGATWSSVLYLPDSAGRAVWGTGPSEIFAGAQRCPSGWAAACGTGRGPQIFRSTDGGASWIQQTLPTTSPPIDGGITHFVGAPNDVYTAVTTWGGSPTNRILRYNGTSWSVVLTETTQGTPSLVYISANEIYGTTCWGHYLWNGSTWTFVQQFDFCDAGSNWGMRDAQGILQLYNSGNNNFTNGVKVWKFTESSPGSKSGSWGSKYGYVFSDGSCGSAYGMWGSAGNDVWAIGNLYYGGTSCGAGPNNEGRIYRFNGTSWGRVTTPFDPLPLYVTAVSGTAPDDVWVANNARLLHFAPSIPTPTPTPTPTPRPTVTPYTSDANTVRLDHFDNSTTASILAYNNNGQACGSALPSAIPSSSFGPGPNGLSQALTLNPPAGVPAGSATYLQYPGGQLLSQANGTIEFWVYLTSYGTGLALVDQGPFYGSCAGWTFGMSVNPTGQLNASAWAAFNMNSGAATVPLNTWTHVAATWGSSGAKLYINGLQVGSDTNTGMPASGYGGSVLIRVGTHAGVSASIDELRISNIQRTTFASPTPTPTPIPPTPTPTSSTKDMVQTFCTIAQWRAGRIITSYAMTAEAIKNAQPHATAIGVTLKFPDISQLQTIIQSAAKKVCDAADPTQAKIALEELKKASEANFQQIQAAMKEVKNTLKAAGEALKARIKEQMKPFAAQAQAEDKKLIDAERQRLQKTGATKEQIKQQMQPFIDQLKKKTQTQLEAKAMELSKTYADHLQAIIAILKDDKAKQEAYNEEGKTLWQGVLKQVVQQQKQLILADVDGKLRDFKAKIEASAQGLSSAERDQRGITALLKAIDQARQELGPVLESALFSGKGDAVSQAIAAFWQKLALASARQMCATAVPKLQASGQSATKILEQLRAVTPQTSQVQEATNAVSTWLQTLQEPERLCAAIGPNTTSKERDQILAALKKAEQDGILVKQLLDALTGKK